GGGGGWWGGGMVTGTGGLALGRTGWRTLRMRREASENAVTSRTASSPMTTPWRRPARRQCPAAAVPAPRTAGRQPRVAHRSTKAVTASGADDAAPTGSPPTSATPKSTRYPIAARRSELKTYALSARVANGARLSASGWLASVRTRLRLASSPGGGADAGASARISASSPLPRNASTNRLAGQP